MNQRDIDQLKKYLPEYLQALGIDISKNFHCLNPEHIDKNTPSMSYWKGKNKVKCFGQCNRTFDIYDIVGFEYGTSNFLEQLEIVKKLYGGGEVFTSANENKRKQTTPERPPEFSSLYPNYHAQLDKTTYFTDRGISRDLQEKFNLGYDEDSKAVVIPISSRYYITRKVKEKAYRNYGSVELFNPEALYQEEPVFITESAIDALSVMELGYQALALNGTPHIKPLLEILRNYPLHSKRPGSKPPLLIIAFDNDEPGQRAALELTDELKALNAPYVLPKYPKWYEDSNQALKLHREAFLELLSDISKLQPKEEAKTMAKEQKKSKLDSLKEIIPEPEPKIKAKEAQISSYLNFFFTGDYKDKYTPTGFTELDKLLYDGLREGLYMVGAVSSMGKTTFCLQMAHQIAAQGYSVAYVALEQGREELLAKSYSLLTEKDMDNHYPITAREVRRYSLLPDHYKPGIEKAIKELSTYADRLYIYEDYEHSIENLVFNHQIETGSAPEVLIIDYLQIMPKPPTLTGGASKKDIVDSNVTMLRRLARKYHNSIITISSLSRYYYNKPLTLAAFKESGDIEHSADYLLGIQPRGMAELCSKNGDKPFDFQAFYKGEERELELVILKARNGIPGEVPLRYNAKYNCFREEYR